MSPSPVLRLWVHPPRPRQLPRRSLVQQPVQLPVVQPHAPRGEGVLLVTFQHTLRGERGVEPQPGDPPPAPAPSPSPGARGRVCTGQGCVLHKWFTGRGDAGQGVDMGGCTSNWGGVHGEGVAQGVRMVGGELQRRGLHRQLRWLQRGVCTGGAVVQVVHMGGLHRWRGSCTNSLPGGGLHRALFARGGLLHKWLTPGGLAIQGVDTAGGLHKHLGWVAEGCLHGVGVCTSALQEEGAA